MATFWATCTLALEFGILPPLASLGEVRASKCNKNQWFFIDFKIAQGPPRDLKGASHRPREAPPSPPSTSHGTPRRPQETPKGPKGPQRTPQRDPKDAQATPRDPKDLPRDLQEAPRDLQGPPRTPKGPQRPSKGPLVVDFGTTKPLSMTRPGGMRGAII